MKRIYNKIKHPNKNPRNIYCSRKLTHRNNNRIIHKNSNLTYSFCSVKYVFYFMKMSIYFSELKTTNIFIQVVKMLFLSFKL